MTRRRPKFKNDVDLGRHYGKFDLDRVGFFDDRPAGPFDQYVPAISLSRGYFKGRQLLPGPGNDLFDKTHRSVFDGAGESPPAKRETGGRAIMLPPSPGKLHSTPNDWYGCIGQPPDYFSPAVRRATEKKTRNAAGEPPNCKIKPNPLGGPGYHDICLNPYPKHVFEPYDPQEPSKKGKKPEGPPARFLTASASLDYFPPNPYLDRAPGPTYVRPAEDKSPKIAGPFYVPFPKRPGGHHAGCFGKFPELTSEPYKSSTVDAKAWRVGGPKFVAGGPTYRTKYTNSLVNQITGISCNVKNYREYRERVYPLTH